MSVDQTLKQRNQQYGDYDFGIDNEALIMSALNKYHQHTQKTEMRMHDTCIFLHIISKLIRAAGNPHHTDSWHDIAGYALLAEEYYKTEKDHA